MDKSKNINAVHVAVGVIQNANGELLIAKRPDHVHQGGLWEFPGGKVNEGETVQAGTILAKISKQAAPSELYTVSLKFSDNGLNLIFITDP